MIAVTEAGPTASHLLDLGLTVVAGIMICYIIWELLHK